MKPSVIEKRQGSMTVEAALVTPIILYAITIFFYFFQLMYLQINLQTALTQVGKKYTRNAYLNQHITDDFKETPNEQTQWLLDHLKIKQALHATVYKQELKQHLDLSHINHSMIVKGFDGLKIEPMLDYFEDDAIDLVLTYQCKIPTLFFFPNEISCAQRVHMKNWTGKEVPMKIKVQEDTESEDSLVYVSETGSVYHWYDNCSHIKLSVKEILIPALKEAKNKSGRRYQPCSVCIKASRPLPETKVYITDYGDSYHQNKTCSGIKRTVHTMTFSQAQQEGRCLCNRCNKRKANISMQRLHQEGKEEGT